MTTSLRRKLMRGEAIRRVLNRAADRAGICSLADLKAAYTIELDEHRAEIAAAVEHAMSRHRAVSQSRRDTHLRCVICDRPIVGAKRASRRYCSAAHRQRAYRQSRL